MSDWDVQSRRALVPRPACVLQLTGLEAAKEPVYRYHMVAYHGRGGFVRVYVGSEATIYTARCAVCRIHGSRPFARAVVCRVSMIGSDEVAVVIARPRAGGTQ